MSRLTKSRKKEIERKFLIINSSWNKGFEGVSYRQGYLSTDPERTVRIRLEGKVGKLTIKGKKVGISADELEYKIPTTDATFLLDNICIQPTIKKKRFKIKYDKVIWEVDVFEGENKGLVLAEVELKNPNQKLKLPKWIGKEVTSDLRFRNSNLVGNPFNKWKTQIKKL